jgi:hypothetical protein
MSYYIIFLTILLILRYDAYLHYILISNVFASSHMITSNVLSEKCAKGRNRLICKMSIRDTCFIRMITEGAERLTRVMCILFCTEQLMIKSWVQIGS